MKHITLAALAALASLALSPSAQAGYLSIDSFAQSDQWGLAFDIRAGGFREAVYAGEFNATLDGSSFLTYCVDIFQSFSWGTHYTNYTLTNPATTLGWLTNAKANDIGRLFTGFQSQVINAVNSSAFQLALWEIVNENSANYNLANGYFTATRYFGNANETLALTTAQNWLNTLPVNSAYRIQVEVSPTAQDMVVANRIPEPGSLALLLGGLGIAGIVGRRQRT